jgi:phospholipid-binding lipoprotein MlaA
MTGKLHMMMFDRLASLNACRIARKSVTPIVLGAALVLSACSSVPVEERSDVRDRYEGANRKVFAFNMGVDSYVLEPVAGAYRDTVPDGAQTAVNNHLRWASLPSTTVNSTLQGKFENAALATLHFLVNGLTLGFADLAADEEEQISKEDFGQTLASWNVPEGSYHMVPVLGPRTTRSLGGTVVDFALNPLSVFGTGDVVQTVNAAQVPVGAVSFRAQNFDAINDVKYNSLDPYARTRSVYYQSRQGLLEDRVARGTASAVSEDEFDSLFEEEIN